MLLSMLSQLHGLAQRELQLMTLRGIAGGVDGEVGCVACEPVVWF